MDRITNKDLQALCDSINKLTGSPAAPYTRGATLSHAYGGVCLERMMTAGGGVDSPLGPSHTTKRDLYQRMLAYINGLGTRNHV